MAPLTTHDSPPATHSEPGQAPLSALERQLLLALVFVAGMCSLATEMAASRLLAPYFGTSLFVWANLIGLILIYLTVGYYLGGRLADRYPRPEVLYRITLAAGLMIGVIPFVSRPILLWSVLGFERISAGIFISSLIAVILLFAVPVTLLGMVSPFAIRLEMSRVNAAGNTSGSIYALSTLGSIIGTFVPVLVTIPNIGTRATFVLFSVALCAMSLVGLQRWPWLLVIVIGLVVPSLLMGRIKPMAGVAPGSTVVYETESAYNYIQVVQSGDNTFLVLNEGAAIHSIYNPRRLLTGGPWDFFLVAPYFNPSFRPSDVHSLAVIGSAAGTVPRQYTEVYGPIPIDGVEIDPRIIQVGRRYFDMNEPNLNAVAQDGRYFLETTSKRYTVVGVDAYRQPYIPFQFTTREFFQLVKDHLEDDGVAAINCGRTPTDRRLVEVIASTMKAVFPNVYTIDVPDPAINTIVVGTKQPTQLQNFAANLPNLGSGPLRLVAQEALPRLAEVTSSPVVFTDDRAPVEQVIDQILLGYIRNGRQ